MQFNLEKNQQYLFKKVSFNYYDCASNPLAIFAIKRLVLIIKNIGVTSKLTVNGDLIS